MPVYTFSFALPATNPHSASEAILKAHCATSELFLFPMPFPLKCHDSVEAIRKIRRFIVNIVFKIIIRLVISSFKRIDKEGDARELPVLVSGKSEKHTL
jgi:hypothetical protein